MGSKSLYKVDLDIAVVQTGRQLERAAREIVPDRKSTEGKPIMLGERMFKIRDQVSDEAWQAFQEWSQQRNKYIHAEIDTIADQKNFVDQFKIVLEELEALGEIDEEEDVEEVWIYFVLAIGLMALSYWAC